MPERVERGQAEQDGAAQPDIHRDQAGLVALDDALVKRRRHAADVLSVVSTDAAGTPLRSSVALETRSELK